MSEQEKQFWMHQIARIATDHVLREEEERVKKTKEMLQTYQYATLQLNTVDFYI